MSTFIDYINMARYKIIDFDLIVFYGCSGSGKSTQIEELIESQWGDKEYSTISASPIPWKSLFSNPLSFKPLIQIDEVHQVRELRYLKKLLAQKYRLVVASHIHPVWFHLLRLKYKVCIINLDRYSLKITMRLRQLKLKFSHQAIKLYLRNYGPSFIELDIILEHYGGNNFDQALRYFLKFNQITQSPNTRPLKLD